jgi:GNAT superfamily N-acetyltransferase
MTVRPAEQRDAEWIQDVLATSWGGPLIERLGVLVDAREAAAFVAEADGAPLGLATCLVRPNEVEILTLDSRRERRGVGSLLLDHIASWAAGLGAHRVMLLTTNDNLDALRFYQRRGYRLVAIHRDSMAEARRIKPSIPELGRHGIPLTDELELELALPAERSGRAG